MCHACTCVFFDWKKGDDPWLVHAESAPTCSFIIESKKTHPKWKNRAVPVVSLGKPPKQRRIFYEAENKSLFTNNKGAFRAKMANPQEREKSFHEIKWDETKRPPIKKMVDAGFYCMGDDLAACFHCGALMDNWSTQTDPIKDHQSYYPWCVVSKISFHEDKMIDDMEVDKNTDPNILVKVIEEQREFLQCTLCLGQRYADYANVACGHRMCKDCITRVDKCGICRMKVLEILKLW